MRAPLHSHIIFTCDQCGGDHNFVGVSFRAAVRVAKEKGWRIEYPRDVPDLCPKCVMERISKAARMT